jgi:hypothetical protein
MMRKGTGSSHGHEKNAYKISNSKPEVTKQRLNPLHKWEDNMKLGFKQRCKKIKQFP